MALAPRSNLSWVEAQPGSIDIPGRNPTAIDRSICIRHQTAFEFGSGSGSSIITSIRLSLPNPSSHLLSFDVVKAAVRQLRFDHPAIASKLAWSAQPPAFENGVFAYEVPGSESDIDVWLSEVVFDRTDVLLASSGDMEKAIDAITYDFGKPGPPGRPLFILHYIPVASPNDQHGLVFFFNHSIFDAIGSFQIMDLCVSKIADSLAIGGQRSHLPWGEETSRLPPAHVESARVPHTTERMPEDEAMLQKIKAQLLSVPNTHKLPRPQQPASSSATGLFTRIISPDALASLRTAARARGCTIFSVLWAAMALSSVRICLPEDNTNITLPFLHSPVDIRSLACDDPYDRSQWKVRLSMGFNSFVAHDLGRFVHSSSGSGDDSHQLVNDVWSLGKEVRLQIEDQKKHKERMPVWIDDMLAIITEAIIKSLGDGTETPTKWYPILSSIGVMDKYLAHSFPVASGQQLTLSSPRLSPSFYEAFGECCLALHAFTWGGELMLAFTFPEGVMGSAQGQLIASKQSQSGDTIALQFVDEFMHILDVTSQSN